MSDKTIINVPDGRGAALGVVGTSVTVLASREQTGGQEFTLQSGDEGTGPPPHSHVWTEAFFVTKGSVEFTCGDETRLCPAGSFVFVPAGTVHVFRYGPGGGEMIEITGPNSSAASLFRELSERLGPGEPDIPTVLDIFGKNNAELHL